jgi:hypothetical protein
MFIMEKITTGLTERGKYTNTYSPMEVSKLVRMSKYTFLNLGLLNLYSYISSRFPKLQRSKQKFGNWSIFRPQFKKGGKHPHRLTLSDLVVFFQFLV